MKVKNLTNEMKKRICILLTAVMVFNNAGMTAVAKEALTAEETSIAEETVQTEETAQAEEAQQGTTADAIEEALTNEASINEILAEETTSETASSQETTSENASETESSLPFTDTSIASGAYKENGNDITWVIDKDGWLTVEGTGDFASPQNSDENRAPWYVNREDIKSAVIRVSDMTNASHMFEGCSYLTKIYLSSFDTSNVTNMSGMFSGCNELNDLDLSSFDTSKVTDMSNMFSGCGCLYRLDFSDFDTSKVTDMSNMFSGCGFTRLDLSNFDTSNVTNMSGMFMNCQYLPYLDDFDLRSFDTSKVTDMSGMFWGCSSNSHRLIDFDLRNFDTSNVTDMSNMFRDCGFISLDLSNFDTSKVTDMNSMFYEYGRDLQNLDLSSLDLSSFDTSNVTDMSYMFYRYTKLKSLDLSSFNTSKVTDMSYMFYYCRKLTSLDLSGFDTSNVTNMSNMFRDCVKLTSLDLSSFDTSNVTNMTCMFEYCVELTSLDLSSFDTTNVTDMGGMFDSCSGLTSLGVSSFDTTSVTDMSYMFAGCSGLTSLDVSSFDTTNVTDMSYMFGWCDELTSLDVSSFDTTNVTDMYNMFGGCSSLTSLDVSNFDTTNVTNMSDMFYACSKLTSLDLSGFDTSNVTEIGGMFSSCSSLTNLDVSSFDTSNVTYMGYMFDSCSGLTSLDLSNFDTSNVTNMRNMFSGCSELTNLNLSSFDTSNVADMTDIFQNCEKLSLMHTPYNVNVSASLPTGDWYDILGNKYTELPTGLSNSILLAKGQTPIISTEQIAAIKEKTTYFVGDTVNTDDLTVRYYGSDGTVKILNAADYTVSKVDTSTAGVKTLIITYKTFTTEIKLTVLKKEESGSTEGSSSGESSSTENSKTDESNRTEESSKTDESSSTEGSKTEESSEHEESSSNDTDAFPVEWEYPETLKIESTTLTAANIEVKTKKRIYDGTPYTPDIKVTVTDAKGKKTVLTDGTDYSVKYSKNTDAGEGTVKVKGNGAYTGIVSKTFTISPKPIKKLKTVTGGIIAGTNISSDNLETLPVYVYDGTKKLTYNKDYTLEVTKGDTAKKGKLEVAVSAKDGSNYTGTDKDAAKATVTVYEATGKNFKGIITSDDVAFEKEIDKSQTYTGKALKPAFRVTVNVDGTPTTLETKDFSVKYTNNKEAGTACATITGKGGYVGSVVKTFEITPVAESGGFSIKPVKVPTYNGKVQKPKVTVMSGGKTLKAGKDYRIAYSNNLHATPESAANTDKAKITVTGIGNYKDMNGTFYFEIKPLEIKKASVKGTQGNLTITYAKHKLVEKYDYEITDVEPDGKKAKVTLTGKGDFTGTVTKKVNTQ